MSVELNSDATTTAGIVSFGSHRNISVGYTGHSKSRAYDSVPARGANIAQFSYSKKFGCAQTFITFPNIRHLPNMRCAQSASIVHLLLGGYAVLANLIKGPRCPKCEEMMALRIIEPERPGFDSRTFECPKCYDTETLVVSISCEVDVSIVSV